MRSKLNDTPSVYFSTVSLQANEARPSVPAGWEDAGWFTNLNGESTDALPDGSRALVLLGGYVRVVYKKRGPKDAPIVEEVDVL